jgi:hypothetical protein
MNTDIKPTYSQQGNEENEAGTFLPSFSLRPSVQISFLSWQTSFLASVPICG